MKRLNNPFLIGLQGFLAGAVIFFAMHPEAAGSRQAAAASAEQAAVAPVA